MMFFWQRSGIAFAIKLYIMSTSKMKLGWLTKLGITARYARLLFNRSRSEAYGLALQLHELRLKRVGALARENTGNFDGFVASLGINTTPGLIKKLSKSFSKYETTVKDSHQYNEAWEKVFFKSNTTATSNTDLLKIENNRIRYSEKTLRPFDVFSYLGSEDNIPYLRLDMDSQDEFFLNWSKVLGNPDKPYDILVKKVEVEESKPIRLHSCDVYYIKYRSPAHSMYDFVYGKVFEPISERCYKTVIISNGWSISNDQEQMWSRLDSLCAKLARDGIRAVLLESPWQGRRTPKGFYSGEQFLSNVPTSMIQMISSQVLETASAIDWARSAKGSRKIVFAGFSMSAYTAAKIASNCRQWSLNYWPDDIIFTEITSLLDRTIMGTKFTKKIGLTQALEKMKWSKEYILKLRQLFDVSQTPSLQSSQIHVFISDKDNLGFRDYTLKIANRWLLSQENITRVNSNHINLTDKIISDRTFEDKLKKILR